MLSVDIGKSMKKAFLILAVVLCSVFTMNAERINGSWNGKLAVGFSPLTLVFHIDGDSCKMDSPDQATLGIPVVLKRCTSDSLELEVPQLQVVYKGVLSNGVIEGVFVQQGHSMPLTLKPGKPEYKRSQNPQPPFPYKTEEVTFVNPVDGAVLSGTLSYPVDYKAGETPVVIMVTGSGQQNRDEEILYHRPFAVIADYLARNGVASLRYDDRGKDKSTGDLTNATTATFATDAEAGIKYLRETKAFGKVGVLGHSEGGTIAFMLAGEGKADFIVSLAGTALRGDKVLVGQNRPLLISKGVPEQMADDYCRAMEKMYEYKLAYGPMAKTNAEMLVSLAIGEAKANLPEQLRENLLTLIKIDLAWFNYFLSYDPVEAIRNIKCPVMAINGSLDTQVLSSPNLAVIRDNLQWKEGDVVREYEGLNHLFQHSKTGLINEYLYIEETISPEVLSDITTFIKTVVSI